MEAIDIIRILNLILAGIIVVLLLRKAYHYWSQYQTRTRDFWWVLLSWSIASIVTVVEILLDFTTSIRVFFTLFALVLTLKVMLRPNEVAKPTFTNEL